MRTTLGKDCLAGRLVRAVLTFPEIRGPQVPSVSGGAIKKSLMDSSNLKNSKMS